MSAPDLPDLAAVEQARAEAACYEALGVLAKEDELYTHAGVVCGRGAHSTGRRLVEILREKGFFLVENRGGP